MSYSFDVRGATIVAAVTAAKARLDAEITRQPVHQTDRAAAFANLDAAAALVNEDTTLDTVVVMGGTVSGTWNDGATALTNCNAVSINVSVYHTARVAG